VYGAKLLPAGVRRWGAIAGLGGIFALSPVGALAPSASRQVEAAMVGSTAPSMQSFQIPSHGGYLNAFVYVAAGAGPHPAVVLLHGFPGNERNLDLAQDIRRAGWDVLYFDYRGSWGSPGDFSFTHGIEDTAAAVEYLRSTAMSRILRLDPTRIVLIGHSMGGFMAVEAAAADPTILGIGLISAADIGGRIPQPLSKELEPSVTQRLTAAYEREGMEPLAGCTPQGLAQETLANAAQWSFSSKVNLLNTRPALIISADDAYAREDEAFAAQLRRAGDTRVATLHLAADHAYSDQRGPLSGSVLRWLATFTNP
jgi:pimeloyl-ACP methyl ester carboxylesterase